MIIVKGVIRTSQIKFCQYNPDTRKMDIVFSDDKKYSYSYSNVEYLKDPEILTPELYHIRKGERDLFNIEAIYRFFGENDTYYHICFQNKSERDYRESELEIFRSCLSEKSAGDVWEYFRQVANLSEMRNEESGEKLLVRKFEKLPFVDEKSVLAKYLNPDRKENEEKKEDWIPIFPFGCNNSQYKAVKRAMENQISVIQGPPGTGKTQTILNIIANILMQGKSVQVVSNNNSATDNVYEKLASPKYGMGFLVAALGNSKNKQTFIQQQNGCYPDLSTWRLETDPNDLKEEIFKKLFFGWEMHVYQTNYQKSFHYNYEQDSETWLKFTKGNAHAETVAMASFITNCEGYKQLVQFNSHGVCYTHYCTGFDQLLLIMFEPAN